MKRIGMINVGEAKPKVKIFRMVTGGVRLLEG